MGWIRRQMDGPATQKRFRSRSGRHHEQPSQVRSTPREGRSDFEGCLLSLTHTL